MDTITHGIAGALIAKALANGEDMLPPRPLSPGRIVTWSLMLGAIFPDSDVFRDLLSSNPMLMITWHRSITHSLLLMPIFALLLAALTRWISTKFKWDAPSYTTLTIIYGVGILSHILLDLVTTFGTMIWSPLAWSRPAWDLIFIVDFTFTAILLVPQLLAWVHRDSKRAPSRSVMMWMLAVVLTFSVAALARILGLPISNVAIFVIILIVSALFLVPAFRGAGSRVKLATWNRLRLVAACLFIALAVVAHHQALERMKKFAAFQGIRSESIAALPFPPSLWNWDGLVRAQRGVYEVRMDLSQPSGIPESAAAAAVPSNATLSYKYFPDAPDNTAIQLAKSLPEVQKVLWFDRFPVTRFHKEGTESVVEILDLRFPQVRPDRPASFTYRVRFDAANTVISQGWARE
jgi:membrane-bound metal-dependent hydrolase YbcI (DUF457 family)